jgi:carbonyl reductase 1
MVPSSSTSAGRVAVVTGANKGIGYCIALQLGLSGLFSHIILACRDASRAELAMASLQQQLPSAAGVTVHAETVTIGDVASHASFAARMERAFGKIDCLINNAGFVYKNADPTPFVEQCKPTLDINFRGTIDFTETLLPLLVKGSDPRIVNVASMSGRLSQLSPSLQAKYSAPDLSMVELRRLVDSYEALVQKGQKHRAAGYGNSNYGLSKLALIAATRILAREHAPTVAINACCPGYCKTDMTSQLGVRDPMDGARNAVLPATMASPPTGAFFADYRESAW